ncbi:expressed unknown protein [Seminavis robusta]|uniref:Uncharacterized protein n=1 Tax=Seminavis robusta TaxID=568900 RepID=A0A9N8E8P4_9STRA|nr:expressed unknown protein [Seminavis robusta]|eukprot:Sro807_g205260.1 n/a (145) ;mRNA; f:27804-28238
MSDQAANNTYDKHVLDIPATKAPSQVQITWMARIAVFIAFPSLVGCLGLYMGYLESRRKPERKLSMEVDFIMPFLLALSMAIVVGFQTKGYTTTKVEPLVKWPKVRKKKVIRKVRKEDLDDQVVVEEEEEEIVEAKDPATKKDD